MTFALGEVEQQALRGIRDLSMAKEYGLRGLNIIRIEPDGVSNPGDAQLTFSIDSSKLSGNIMINRIQCEVEYTVIATGSLVQPAATHDGNGFATNLGTTNIGYLMSPSNGAMDALCVNKSFSSIELSNKQVQLVQDSRNPEKVDILSRLLSAENLDQAGVYLDNTYGSITEKAGGAYELGSVFNPTLGQSVYGQGCGPEEILEDNLFWKRNTNQQYIKKKSNAFFTGAEGTGTAVAGGEETSNHRGQRGSKETDRT